MSTWRGRDKALEHGLAPRTANREHAGDPGTASPPPEPIVFLTPWRKYGKSRIYVKDEEGSDGGYLDLVSGEVSSDSSTAASVLSWLLPHYLDGDGDLDEAELGVIRRFLKKKSRKKRRSAEPIVVGYRWQNHGRSRLYVSRIDAEGTKVDLGWYDLKEQRVHEEAAGLAPIVRYCGERYESVDSRR